jgi:hypothetical protein
MLCLIEYCIIINKFEEIVVIKLEERRALIALHTINI